MWALGVHEKKSMYAYLLRCDPFSLTSLKLSKLDRDNFEIGDENVMLAVVVASRGRVIA